MISAGQMATLKVLHVNNTVQDATGQIFMPQPQNCCF